MTEPQRSVFRLPVRVDGRQARQICLACHAPFGSDQRFALGGASDRGQGWLSVNPVESLW